MPRKFFARASAMSFVQQLRAFRHFAANVDVGKMNVVRKARDDSALEHLVRIFVNDLAIFERAWLGFIRIANQVNWLATLAIHERPLQPARKARAPTTTQSGKLDVVANLFLRRFLFAVGQIQRLHCERLFEHLITAVPQIAFDVGRVTRLVGVFQNQFVFLRHIKVMSDEWQVTSRQTPGLTGRAKRLGCQTRRLARWCNGSTADSGSVCHGSNPCRAANSQPVSRQD